MTVEQLKDIANELRADFGIRFKSVDELPYNYKHFGDCTDDGCIRVRLKQYNKRRVDLKRATVIRTLCHELAHTIAFNHTKRFKFVERMMIKWAKKRRLF